MAPWVSDTADVQLRPTVGKADQRFGPILLIPTASQVWTVGDSTQTNYSQASPGGVSLLTSKAAGPRGD